MSVWCNATSGCSDDCGSRARHQHNHRGDDDPSPTLASARLANDQLGIDEFGCLTRNDTRGGHNGATMDVTMRNVKLDRNDAMAFHDQVAAEIRRDIMNGDVRPGERLPPARDMAAVLGVHTNTVLRALRILRDEGVLEFRRGRGVTVSGEPERGVLWSQAQDLLAQARQFGLQREELVSIINSLP